MWPSLLSTNPFAPYIMIGTLLVAPFAMGYYIFRFFSFLNQSRHSD